MVQYDYTFTCDVCGGEFYSKVDPSGWRSHKCNKCSGKNYKDYPVSGSTTAPTYQPKATPTKPVYNNVAPQQVTKKEFNLEEYIADMLITYSTLKTMCDENKLTIPEDSLCSWTTSIMIQKGRI